ncbi:MAG: hypothetical protein ACXW00_05715 [Methylobacter sp.]
MNLKDLLTRLENRPAYKLTADWFFTPEEEESYNIDNLQYFTTNNNNIISRLKLFYCYLLLLFDALIYP